MDKQSISEQEFRLLYGYPQDFIVNAYAEELEDSAKTFIQACPFMILSSKNDEGYIDMSPRGGEPGFIKIIDNKHIAFLDQMGNKKLHTLSNLDKFPEVGLMFMIPGIGEILRAYGVAHATPDEALIREMGGEPKRNKTVISIRIDKIFPHCPKAINKSGIWNAQEGEKPQIPNIMELAKSMSDSRIK